MPCVTADQHLAHWHINCLEIMAVILVLKVFLSILKRHHVLVHSDNMMLVANINHQGGLRMHPVYQLVRGLLL